MMLTKVLAITATLCSFSFARECGADGCESGFDETSLIQIQKSVELGTDRKQPGTVTQTTVTTISSDSDPDSDPQAVINAAIAPNIAAANAQVAGAEQNLAEKVSDDKVAKANQYVQKFATEVAKWNMKGAQIKHDWKAKNLYTVGRKRTAAEDAVFDATQRAKESAAAWKAATDAEINATKLAHAANLASAQRRDAALNATAAEKQAYAAMRETQKSMHNKMQAAKANYTMFDAKASADKAATSRLRAEAYAANAMNLKANASAVAQTTALADKNATELVKKAQQMEALAAKYANAAKMSYAKAAAVNQSAGRTEMETVVTTQTQQVSPR